MDNEPINFNNNFQTPKKSPNPKIFGIGAAIAAVLVSVARPRVTKR